MSWYTGDMPDETTATPDAATSTPAPAASAPPPSEPTQAAAPASDPGPSGATNEQSKDPWDPDSFGWDDWDGSSYDDFPEDVRPLAERFSKWHSDRTESQRQEQERLQMLYDALLGGEEDPRLAEYIGKYETATKELDAYRTKYDEARREVESVINFVMQQEEARLKSEADAFEAANKWLFTPEYEGIAVELLDAGFDYKVLPELVKLPKSIRDTAKTILDKTKDSVIAIRVAKAEASPKSSDPGTAPFMADSTSPAPKARTTEKPSTKGPLNSDRILATVRDHLKRAKR